MVRLILFLLAVVALATGLAWLADRPGNLLIHWQGYEIETSVFRAVVLLAALLGLVVLAWSVLRQIWNSPAAIGRYVLRRRQKRGLEALSAGMIAIGAGDRSTATRYALQARRSLPNEPLTHLLRAQAAQLAGDRPTARRVFEAMLGSPDTEQLGLRGLYLEAEREGETEAARQFAERALRLNPQLAWPAEALFDLQCKQGDWAGALATLAVARRHGHIEKASAQRRRAVLLTAQAQAAEDTDPEKALRLSLEAHALAADLVPAAVLSARLLASRGHTPRATKVVRKTWARAPHPDLATVYAHARLGDSPRDRLERVKQLTALNPYSIESPIAVANAAIEARDFAAARAALQPLLDGRLTRRVCLLMARIEGEAGNKGGVREWLGRAVNAARDPAWTADGVVAEHWAPTSPVTGALDAFQWRVPVETLERSDGDLLARKIEELVSLGSPAERAIAAAPAADSVATPAEAKAEPQAETATAPRPTTWNGREGFAAEHPAAAPTARRTDGAAKPASPSTEVVIVPPTRTEPVALPAPLELEGRNRSEEGAKDAGDRTLRTAWPSTGNSRSAPQPGTVGPEQGSRVPEAPPATPPIIAEDKAEEKGSDDERLPVRLARSAR